MNNNIIQNSKSKPPSRSHIRPSKSPSPDVANLRRQTKINTANPIISQSKKYSVHDEMEKMKQRREERKKRIEDEKRSLSLISILPVGKVGKNEQLKLSLN
jgi:hypothetical protein